MRNLIVLLLLLTPRSLFAQRAIPDDNLGLPVLVGLTDCANNVISVKGSGFFLNDGNGIYLVTARHVLFGEVSSAQPTGVHPLLCQKAETLSYSKDPKERQQTKFSLDLRALNAGGSVKAHPTHDVAVVQIARIVGGTEQANTAPSATYSIELLGGVQYLQNAPSGILATPINLVKRFDAVLVSNDIYVLGFPSSIGMQQAPQIDYNTPLIRKGIVAGANNGNKTLVLDCLTFQGNSGGPVLEVTRDAFRINVAVVGVVSQYVPITETWVNTTLSYFNMQIHNSGYSIAEPMDPVLELIGK